VDVGALGVADGAVEGLLGQLLHADQDVGHLVQGAFTGLHQGDAVGRVAAGLLQGPDVGLQALADGQAGGVVAGAVDAQTAAQLLDAVLEALGGGVQVPVGVQGAEVRVDADTHVRSSVDGSSDRCASVGAGPRSSVSRKLPGTAVRPGPRAAP